MITRDQSVIAFTVLNNELILVIKGRHDLHCYIVDSASVISDIETTVDIINCKTYVRATIDPVTSFAVLLTSDAYKPGDIFDELVNDFDFFLGIPSSGGGGTGEPTNITSTDFVVGGSGYSRSINIKTGGLVTSQIATNAITTAKITPGLPGQVLTTTTDSQGNYIVVWGDGPTPPVPTLHEIKLNINMDGEYTFSNRWINTVSLQVNDGAIDDLADELVIPLNTNDIITITEKNDGDFRTWRNNKYPFVLMGKSGEGDVSIISLPHMDIFTTNMTGTIAGNNFFRSFNSGGAITSLPKGSFDTSNIITVGDNFFYSFISDSALTSLPKGSFDTSNITTVGNAFFAYFNSYGALTSLPEGSFDTSKITIARDYFFDAFNSDGALESLPDGSFNTSKITTVEDYFFRDFNRDGKLTKDVKGIMIENISEDDITAYYWNGETSDEMIITHGDYMYYNSGSPVPPVGNEIILHINTDATYTFTNQWINTVSLRVGSNPPMELLDSLSIKLDEGDRVNITEQNDGDFRLWNGGSNPLVKEDEEGTVSILSMPAMNKFTVDEVGTIAGDNFFNYFNAGGVITSLPTGSFDTHNMVETGYSFFTNFNQNGKLESLPKGSFDIINLSPIKSYIFDGFNTDGALESLPDGSFNTSKITTVGNDFFSNFNYNGALTSLPEGSFDTSSITAVGDYFFDGFNMEGALTSLPEGSFNTSKITTVGDNFFAGFNNYGALTSLPEGSFQTGSITTARDYFFAYFNSYGALTSLPVGSFDTSNITTTDINYYFLSFNENGKIPKDIQGILIKNRAFEYITAYYWDQASQSSFSEDIAYNGYMYYNSGSPVPPVGNMIELTVNTDATYTFTNQWTSTVSLQVNDGAIDDLVTTKNIQLSSGDHVRIIEKNEGDFRTWHNSNLPLVSSDGKGTVELISIPSMSMFTKDEAGTTAGDYFFMGFNQGGALLSLPEGSFETSKITSAGDYFFYGFNYGGKLSSLPVGSFDTSKITTVGNHFFNGFNAGGKLTSLPVGSFNTSKITTVGNYFFHEFNYGGKLSSLPVGSFDTSSITTVGNYFFVLFNFNGALTSLPVGSFDTSSITTVGDYFFALFNYHGALTSLPVGSFQTGSIITARDYFFIGFNYEGALTSLPESSFKTDSIITVGNDFFMRFNNEGALTSLPVGSFNTINITTVRNNFFFEFNMDGALTSLPVGSFDTSNIKSVGDDFFFEFNSGGKLVKDPDGVQIFNPTKVNITAYYWNGSSSDVEIITNGQSMYYNSGSPVPPVGNVIELTINKDETYTFTNQWTSTVSLQVNDGPEEELVNTKEVQLVAGNTVKIIEKNNGDFRAWRNDNSKSLVYLPSDDEGNVVLKSIPSMNAFTVDEAGTTAGDNFFNYFNASGALISLPEDSFDTSNITNVGYAFFHQFNSYAYLKTLPKDSFDTSNIQTVGNDFFTSFNQGGDLLSLPEDSFDTSNITTVGKNFFSGFNSNGKLTSLPVGSFDTSSITSVGEDFFSSFNSNGGRIPKNIDGVQIMNRTNDLITAYYWDGSGSTTEDVKPGQFMCYDSPLVPPVIHEMEFSINTTGDYIITNQWSNIVLVQLNDGIPQELEKMNIHLTENDTVRIIEKGEGDFRTWMEVINPLFVSDDGIGDVSLNSIPSMDAFTVDVAGTAAGDYFFYRFNNKGLITSLPVGSFDTSSITSAGDYFFYGFNQDGKLSKDADGVQIYNPNGTITVYYLNSDTETIEHGGYMYYNIVPPVPPVLNEIILTVNMSTTYTFNNRWNTPVLIQVNDTPPQNLIERLGISLTKGDTIKIIEKSVGDFRIWQSYEQLGDPFVYNMKDPEVGDISVDSFPPMNAFTVDEAGTIAGDNFFFRFNGGGALTSLPVGSFNTFSITTVGNRFFTEFNSGGKLTSLPVGSFNTFSITTVGNDFFKYFNFGGSLTTLPVGSFDTSNITTLGDRLFEGFNNGGKLTKRNNDVVIYNPNGTITAYYWNDSSQSSDAETIEHGGSMYYNSGIPFPPLFNRIELTVNTDGTYRFFNQWTAPVSLRVGSTPSQDLIDSLEIKLIAGDTITITEKGGDDFRTWRDDNGPLVSSIKDGTVELTSIPSMNKFTKDEAGTTAGDNFFRNFTAFGTLINLPVGSFNTSNITTVGNNFFMEFNNNGALTTLPDDSFDTSSITTVGNNFFLRFNEQGKLSKDTDGVHIFNANGDITAYYWEGITETLKNGEYMHYNTVPPVPPVGNMIELTVNNDATYRFYNQWTSTVSLRVNDGAIDDLVDTLEIKLVAGNTVKIIEKNNGDFRTWTYTSETPLVSSEDGTVELTSIPSMNSFTVDEAGTTAGDYFFDGFNFDGALTSLPEDSFDTSNIITVGNNFFSQFIQHAALTSLPVGSFNTSNIQTVGNNFFMFFNFDGALTSLPVGSFDIGSITTVGNDFFANFNLYGALTNLPVGSFDTSKITTVGNYFFDRFNQAGKLTTLPEGSFNTSKITTVGNGFFRYFNFDGALTSLPVGSFNTSSITTVGNDFFAGFNQQNGKLVKDPLGVQIYNPNGTITAYYWNDSSQSSDTETLEHGDSMYYNSGSPVPPVGNMIELTINKQGNYTFTNQWTNPVSLRVNDESQDDLIDTKKIELSSGDHVRITQKDEGDFRTWRNDDSPLVSSDDDGTVELTSIPSMDKFTTDITGTTAGDNFFRGFNNGGSLTSLPVGSFNTSSITTVGNTFFHYFNYGGKLITLPNNSFNTSNILSIGHNFFTCFNSNGLLMSLPTDSFNISNIIIAFEDFFSGFNLGGALTSLPEGSFNTSSITTVGDYFFFEFNYNGSLTSLPAGSFDTNKITTFGTYIFYRFNGGGMIPKDTAGVQIYNPNGTITAYYWNDSSQSSDTETITNGQSMYYNSGSPVPPEDDGIELTINKQGNYTFTNQWTNPVSLRVNDESQDDLIDTKKIQLNKGNTVRITQKEEGDFRTWNSSNISLVSSEDGTVELTSIPSMDKFTTDTGGTTAGDNFFMGFNSNGALTSLPVGSFNTENIKTVGGGFFANFNMEGSLTSLPEGSFNTSKITTVEEYFFAVFNERGKLTSLPVGSFNTENIKTVGGGFFEEFNFDGKLVKDMDGVDIFNPNGDITAYYWNGSSSDVEIITNGQSMYYNSTILKTLNEIKLIITLTDGTCIFNNQWTNTVSISVNNGPTSDLDTSITLNLKVDDIIIISEKKEGDFRTWRNNTDPLVTKNTPLLSMDASIIQLPPMNAFTTDQDGKTAGDNFFMGFNYNGILSIQTDGFQTDNITTVGDNFFAYFNAHEPIMGGLSILPYGSFNTINIKSTGNNFFYRFNFQGTISKDIDGIAIYNESGGSIIGYYFDEDTHTSKSELISTGNPMYYKSK